MMVSETATNEALARAIAVQGRPARWRRERLVTLTILILAVTAGWLQADDAGESGDSLPQVTLTMPPNVELRVMIEYVSDRLDLNILYENEVGDQRVTIRAPRRVPADSLLSVLESALHMKGFVLIEDEAEGWLRIVPSRELVPLARRVEEGEEVAPRDVVTEVFEIAHADPSQVQSAVTPFLTRPGGNLQLLAERRLLIISDFARNMTRIAELVDLVDRQPQEIQTAFVAAQHLSAPDLAEQASRLLATQQRVQQAAGDRAVKPLEITHEARTNQVVLIGTPSRVAEATELLQSLDVPLELETRVYSLESAEPRRIDRLVQELIDPTQAERLYRSAIDEAGNLLIVTATPSIHEEVEALKERLDLPLAEAPNPVRFYRLMNVDAGDVLATVRALEGEEGFERVAAEDMQALREQAGEEDAGAGDGTEDDADREREEPAPPAYRPEAEPPERQRSARPGGRGVRSERATVVADPMTNSIIVVGDPIVHRIYERLIEQLDRRRPQVLIETTVVTVDTSRGFSLGVEIGAREGFSIDGHDIEALTFSAFGLSGTDAADGRLVPQPGAGFTGAVLSPDLADVVIRALATSGRAEVSSAPRVLVNDASTGRISSVNEQPYTSVNAFDQVATTSFAGFVEAGTDITVTPFIAEGDHLRLEFDVALRAFQGGGGGEGIPPPRQSNTVSSSVTVPDGHTIIVGGVNRHDLSETVEAVPILGEIPLIKHLFRSQDRSNQNSTLFVFIRPVILRDDQFEDLKHLSRRNAERAGLRPDAPVSTPMLMR